MEQINADVLRSNSSPLKRAGSSVECPLPIKKGSTSPDADKPATKITSLPMEVMHKIFLNLDPSSLLSARATCSFWNFGIEARPCVRSLCFTLQRDEDGNSYDLFNSKEIPWEQLKIQNYSTSIHPIWNFPATLDTSLKALTMSGGSFTWSWLMSLTRKFQSLEKLTLRNCNIEEQGQKMDTFTGTKRPLIMRLELANHAATNRCLEQIVDNEDSPFDVTLVEIAIPFSIYEKSTGRWVMCLPDNLEEVEKLSERLLSSNQELFFRTVTSAVTSSFVWTTSAPEEPQVLVNKTDEDDEPTPDCPLSPVKFNAQFTY